MKYYVLDLKLFFTCWMSILDTVSSVMILQFSWVRLWICLLISCRYTIPLRPELKSPHCQANVKVRVLNDACQAKWIYGSKHS
jgi:hypothetical protein